MCRNLQTIQVKQTIVRNSQYSGKPVKEEDVQMPTHHPTPAPRQSLQDRIRVSFAMFLPVEKNC